MDGAEESASLAAKRRGNATRSNSRRLSIVDVASSSTSSSSWKRRISDHAEHLGVDIAISEEKEDADRFRELLVERGCGSLLRGWRSELDPEGAMEVHLGELAKAALRLGFHGDVVQLITPGSMSLSIEDLDAEKGAMIDRFKDWVKDVFGGPKAMFEVLAGLHEQGYVTSMRFTQICKAYRGPFTDKELKEVYACCDCFDTGRMSIEDMLFLETDDSVRELEAFVNKMKGKYRRQNQLACFYREEQRKDLDPLHRLAIRPWHAESFERLPKVMSERRMAYQLKQSAHAMQARSDFVAHLTKLHGNAILAWRRELDPNGTFSITLSTLRMFCSRVGLNIDTSAVWRALDKNNKGGCTLEELCPDSAMVLASFKGWAAAACGSCEGVWDSQHAEQARLFACSAGPEEADWSPSDNKMRFKALADVLRELGWSEVDSHRVRSILFGSLDLFGCGLVSRADLVWLDQWEAPPWMVAQPSEASWLELREHLGETSKSMLRAWRLLFDMDSSNTVDWTEFKEGCSKLGFAGDVAGAWRHLDSSLDGFITIRTFDAPLADLLVSFKSWADTHFGSMKRLFKALDMSLDGQVSFGELRRTCNRLKWQGDVFLLFNALDVDYKGDINTRGYLSYKEVSFLETWELSSRELKESLEDSSSAGAAPPWVSTASPSGTMHRASTARAHSSIVPAGALHRGAPASASAPALPMLPREHAALPSTCPSCGQSMAWSSEAKGSYALGWKCNAARCGSNSSNCGKFRWLCKECQIDICRLCCSQATGHDSCDEFSTNAMVSCPRASSRATGRKTPSTKRQSASRSGNCVDKKGAWGDLPGVAPYWATITSGVALEKWQHQEPRKVWRSPVRLHPLCPGTPSTVSLTGGL